MDGFLTGKTLSSLTTDYRYSSRGELLEARLPGSTVITYEHDPLGRRIAKRVGGAVTEKYLWANATTLLAVYDGSDQPITRFNYGDDRMPVSMTHNGENYYLLYDPVGSLRGVTDTAGTMIKRIDYDSFGNIVVDSNSSLSVPFGFAGGLHDRATGLVRFGARDYDPAIGRWTAKDPIDFAGGDANLYGYVGGDPVNWVDPGGLWNEDVHYYRTLDWALSVGISAKNARTIAYSDNRTDGGIAGAIGVGFSPIIGDQSRHFNRSKSGCDSRDVWANREFEAAVNLYRTGDAMSAFGALGRGLHSIQDKFAHHDWNTGPFGLRQHPSWFDNFTDPRNLQAQIDTETATKKYILRFRQAVGM